MYQRNTHIRSFKGGQNKFSRNSRGGNFRGGFSGNRMRSMPANPDLFIKKASPCLLVDEYIAQNSFESFNLNPVLKSNIDYKGYKSLTPIQDQTIPSILEGRDLIGLASTGTGKTAAFLIPLIEQMSKNPDKKALIITPTRELAQQIQDEFKDFAYNMKLYSSLIIGGANMYRQIQELRRNPHVVIATPGRLKDLIRQQAIYLEDYSSIVLDEVDLMVDIGFLNDVRYFISFLPKNRQSLFFSATIPTKIQGILQSFVNNPITVSVKKQDTSENVDQDVIRVSCGENKVEKLHDLLVKDGFNKVLIFGRTKHGIEKLNKELDIRGFKVGAIHGNKRQSQRQRVLDSFKASQIQILLATDVASRGLDIPNVTHVINYELPETFDDYIHRIGRTGRAGKTGIALTFI
ncbi:MAG: DEAD/DEAH box helicase [Candidatus Daviesbacteria bacterium]|nr:DEAD/DEAH box helicase [Candidatus Daviesbacteria bacterium]